MKTKKAHLESNFSIGNKENAAPKQTERPNTNKAQLTKLKGLVSYTHSDSKQCEQRPKDKKTLMARQKFLSTTAPIY